MLSFEDFNKKAQLVNYYPYNLTLNLTNNCNLACRYCFVQQEPQNMTLDIAKKSIDFVYKNYIKHKNKLKDIINQKIDVVLFGGEPLLTFKSVIEPLFTYIEQNYLLDFFTFSITTNGTLLTDEVCQFLKKYNISVQISFDGLKQIQTINRPYHNKNKNSFDDIMFNLENYILEYDLDFAMRATADFQHINLWYDNFIFFNALPIKTFTWSVEYYKNLSPEELVIAEEQIKKICKSIYVNIQYYNKIPIFTNYFDYLSLIFEHDYNLVLNKEVDTNVYLNNYCGYNLEYITIDYQGKIYPCREEPCEYRHLKCHPTEIGDIENGIDINKLDQLRDIVAHIEYNFLNNRQCEKNCWFKQNNFPCQYIGCPSHAFKQKDITIGNCQFSSIFCQQIAEDLNQLIKIDNNKEWIKYLRNNFYDFNFLHQYQQAPPVVQQMLIEGEKNK